jgi:hypothetical protein
MHFFISFPLETDFFFANFEWNLECTTERNQMKPSNTVSVATLIEEIQSELKDQTGSWRKVSELLNQADVEFGFATSEMKQILDQTDISPNKASKLISIAQDDRIRQNSKVFETVSAWATLYRTLSISLKLHL